VSRLFDIQPDPELMRLAGAGEPAAQRCLYDLMAGPAFALICRLVRDRAAAEDLFQDSLMSVFRHLPDFRGEAPFGAWARQIVVRHCLMHLRAPWQRARLALQEVLSDEGDNVPAAFGALATDPQLADRIDLERALARLSETARSVLWLHDVEGLTHEEIAAAYGRSVSFSKSQLARAHGTMRGLLDEFQEGSCQLLNPATAPSP
jgi:RNA polymerase sigma factor (sigma-70 family)